MNDRPKKKKHPDLPQMKIEDKTTFIASFYDQLLLLARRGRLAGVPS